MLKKILGQRCFSFLSHRLCASLLSVFALSITDTLAHQRLNCENTFKHQKAQTIDELIAQSDYIGMYIVSKHAPEAVGDHANHAFGAGPKLVQHTLTLKSDLTYFRDTKAPAEIFALALKGSGEILPSRLFNLDDEHQVMVETDNPNLGWAGMVTGPKGECVYVATFIKGYSYLVFGGANSRAVYEPILSTRHDPFYNALMRRLDEFKTRKD